MENTATDPIHQFNIYDLIPIHIGGVNLSFTNAALFMAITAIIGGGFLYLTTGSRSLVPNRMQSASEVFYDFTEKMLRESAGSGGMRYFPFVFTLFCFLLVGNLIGIFPYFFTITAQIVVTFALAIVVILMVIISGFRNNGLRFLKLFVPSGVPGPLLVLVVPIEMVSFISRPISLSIRLFGNMLAGHITLKVFAGFVVSLSAIGALGVLGAILPLIMAVLLTALEILVAALQAYVFAVLTCLYLNDALHPSH